MTPIQEQFTALQEAYPEAKLECHPDRTATVIVPSVELPQGWAPDKTTVLFHLPVGYPHARPDCFWTTAQLRLLNGGVPQNTGQNQIPNGPNGLLWFSWHVQNW